MKKARGFTLVEVLVALGIVAIALVAGLQASAALTANAQRQSDVLLAHICAENELIRLRLARQMPPVGEDRPDDATYDAVVRSLETTLDRSAAAAPNPGRTATLRRLTRTEYQNAIRDLLALEIDASALLPGDESSYGFDNVTVGDLSPTLLDRYVSAAEKMAWLGQELQLSDKQKKKVRPMLQDMQTQIMAVKGNPNLTPEQKKAKALPIVQNTMSTIRTKVLNKEQRAKYDAMKEQAIQKMLATRGGQPAPGGPPQ